MLQKLEDLRWLPFLLILVGCAHTKPVAARAALAFRDSVPRYQELGSKWFTRRVLVGNYQKLAYHTQKTSGEIDELREPLTRLLREYQEVDLFLLAHSNRFIDVVASLQPELRQRLRLVYNTGCADAEQGPKWIALGADAYVGHQASSAFSPIFYYYFAPLWVAGENLEQAVGQANYLAMELLDWLSIGSKRNSPLATLYGLRSLWIAQ